MVNDIESFGSSIFSSFPRKLTAAEPLSVCFVRSSGDLGLMFIFKLHTMYRVLVYNIVR